jgi:lipase
MGSRAAVPRLQHWAETSETWGTVDVPETTTGRTSRGSAEALHLSEPFQTYFDVPVAGGALTVARAGLAPEAARTVVLVFHGMTSSHMAYRTVARELCSDGRSICLLAPDLRGRGRSAHLPEPYGISVHVADMIAVLDHVGAERAIVVGHSMGCNIAARFGADHPDRTAAVVLLDGGLPLLADSVVYDDAEEDEQHGLFDRFEMTFATVEEYLAFWQEHPSLKGAWDEDVDAFVRSDLVEDENGVRSVVKQKAALRDIEDVMLDRRTWTSVTRVQAPVRLLRAERGLFDDDPVIPLPELEEFVRDHPHISVELVPDVNHFTLVMGGGHGPRRVTATLAELAAGELPG